VADGQECKTVRRDQGDGTFREEQQCQTKYREEPVMDDKCTWQGNRWESDRTETASGGLKDTPHWPQVSLNCPGQSRVSCERESSRQENYWVHFKAEEGDEGKCDFPQAEWSEIPLESLWTGQVGRFVFNIRCDTLVRK
jgi:hypothetical protein